jgi:hypothetical protein
LEIVMKRILKGVLPAVTAGILGAAPAALADNLLGLYVGAGVGTSNVGDRDYFPYPEGYYGGFHDHDAAWKVLAGVRPIPFLGAEAEWIDFGSAGGNDGYYNGFYNFNASSHPKAGVLFAVGYLPLPLPFIDIYGKAGIARLQTDISFQSCPGLATGPSGPTCTPVSYRTDQWNDKVAYGAGLQAKFQDFAFRAEYERISSGFGDPAAFMVSATWTF